MQDKTVILDFETKTIKQAHNNLTISRIWLLSSKLTTIVKQTELKSLLMKSSFEKWKCNETYNLQFPNWNRVDSNQSLSLRQAHSPPQF